MFIVISQLNPDPLYKQIKDQVKTAIAAGDIAPGEKLPSIREMARELNISEITIKRAYADLEQDGFILTRAGMGSFVASIDREGIRKVKLEEVRRRLHRLAGDAAAYGIKPSDMIAILREFEELKNGNTD